MGDNGKELHIAACDGDEATMRALLDEGVHPDEFRDRDGWTALHTAAGIEHGMGAARLLIEARADIEAKDHIGNTPVHLADVAQLLLNSGANVAARDETGLLPLHYAARMSDAAMIEILMLWGADVDTSDDVGVTPRSWASNWRNSAAFDAAVARVRGLFWSRAVHPRLPPRPSEVVVTVLLYLRRVATTATPRAALHQAMALPAELWEMILGFVRAVDLLPRGA